MPSQQNNWMLELNDASNTFAMRRFVKRTLTAIGILFLILVVTAFVWLSPYSPYRFGNYIPRDLDDTHACLLKLFRPEDLRLIRDMPSEKDMNFYHMGLGMGIRNSWALWSGSRLSHYFNRLGINHPDDMSAIILETFWRKIHAQPLHFEERLDYYQRWSRHSGLPQNMKTPTDGARIEFDQTHLKGMNDVPRFIHVGKSVSDGSVWVFDHDKGLRPLSPQVQKELDEKPWRFP